MTLARQQSAGLTATPELSGSPHLAPLVVTTVSVQTRVLDSSPVQRSTCEIPLLRRSGLRNIKQSGVGLSEP